MPLTDANESTNVDGSANGDYCMYCCKDGRFTQDFNMSQMIEFCVRYTDQMNEAAGWNLIPERAREQMRAFFPTLKRWQGKDERSLAQRAEALLAQCEEVTLASIDADGFPRPVTMSKSRTMGCGEVWMATGADSMKVAEFRRNPKAGLCYSSYGDSVALRGTVRIVTDDEVRERMWQDWSQADRRILPMCCSVSSGRRPPSGSTVSLPTNVCNRYLPTNSTASLDGAAGHFPMQK